METQEQEESILNGKTLLFQNTDVKQTKGKHERWGKQNLYILSPAVYTETPSFPVDISSKKLLLILYWTTEL